MPTVKGAKATDADSIARVIQEVYLPFSQDFSPTALGWNAQRVFATYKDWLIAHDGGKVIGVVHHLRDPEGYTFDALAVLESYRRAGVGSHLVAEVERRAGLTDAPQIIIALRSTLIDNVTFFRDRGYRPVRQHTAEHDVFVKLLVGSP